MRSPSKKNGQPMADGSKKQNEEMAEMARHKAARMELIRKRVQKYAADGLNLSEISRVLGVSTTLVKRMILEGP
jgi:DNA-directed RNA polymerase specialized sigma24 family protein